MLFEVECTCHVTALMHIEIKMADEEGELYVWGDDLEAVLDILGEDEAVDKHFTISADNVSLKFVKLVSYFPETELKHVVFVVVFTFANSTINQTVNLGFSRKG